MEIILVSKHASGQAALPVKRIGGHLAPERQYHIVDHKVILSGHPDKVLRHDAQELLAMPDNLYRMPTPSEQEQWRKEAEQTAMVQETEQGEPRQKSFLPPALEEQDKKEQDDSSDLEDDEEASAQDDQDIEEDLEQKEEEQAPTVPPALEEKPKRHYNRKK